MTKDSPVGAVLYLRIAFIPFFIILLSMENFYTRVIALIIFIADCLIDIYINHYKEGYQDSAGVNGTLSVLVDKLLISAAFICFIGIKELSVPVWMVILIVLNEFVTSGLKSIAVSRNDKISIKTNPKSRFIPKGGIVVLIFTVLVTSFLENSSGVQISSTGKFVLEVVPYWLTLLIAGFSASSGINCVIRNIKVLKEGVNNE